MRVPAFYTYSIYNVYEVIRMQYMFSYDVISDLAKRAKEYRLASQGKTEADFNVIDRLCYTGSRGMLALEKTL